MQNKFGHVETISYLCSIKKNKEKQRFKTAVDRINTDTETMTTKIIDNSATAAKVSAILLILGFASLVACFITCHPLFFVGVCFLLPLAFSILLAVDNN